MYNPIYILNLEKRLVNAENAITEFKAFLSESSDICKRRDEITWNSLHNCFDEAVKELHLLNQKIKKLEEKIVELEQDKIFTVRNGQIVQLKPINATPEQLDRLFEDNL